MDFYQRIGVHGAGKQFVVMARRVTVHGNCIYIYISPVCSSKTVASILLLASYTHSSLLKAFGQLATVHTIVIVLQPRYIITSAFAFVDLG